MNTESLTQRNLPHWDKADAAYFVTTCLEGSIPARGQLEIVRYRNHLRQRVPAAGISQTEWDNRVWKLSFARAEQWLDREPAVRHLENPQLARVVVDAMKYFAGTRYRLIAYAVMPSHFHWVFQPLPTWIETINSSPRSPRSWIVHSINRHTALRCNELLSQTGTFWQHESYDHWVRDDGELERIIAYVENNPVKAGLVQAAEDWPFSSAYKPRK